MLHNKAILMKLGLPSFNFARIDRKVTAETLTAHGADPKSGRFIKILLSGDVTKPITRLLDEVYEYHRQRTLPWADDGTRLLPTAHFDDYMGKMRVFTDQLSAVGKTFEDNYDQYLAEARTRLNGMFNEGDYPAKQEISARLRIQLEPAPVPDGKDFRVSVNAAELSEMQASIAERVAAAEKAARVDLYQRIAEPLAKMISRLSDPEAVFRNTLVTNLMEVADLIPALNITGDPGLESTRQRIKDELALYSPDMLREHPSIRQRAADKAQAIYDQMSVFMGT